MMMKTMARGKMREREDEVNVNAQVQMMSEKERNNRTVSVWRHNFYPQILMSHFRCVLAVSCVFSSPSSFPFGWRLIFLAPFDSLSLSLSLALWLFCCLLFLCSFRQTKLHRLSE